MLLAQLIQKEHLLIGQALKKIKYKKFISIEMRKKDKETLINSIDFIKKYILLRRCTILVIATSKKLKKSRRLLIFVKRLCLDG